MTVEIVGIGVYLGLQLAIGVWVCRRDRKSTRPIGVADAHANAGGDGDANANADAVVDTERGKLRMARVSVVLFGVLAYAAAIASTSIYGLVETASSFGTSGILVITLFGLYSRHGGKWSALATLVVGAVAVPVAEHLLAFPAPFLLSIGAAAVTFVFCEVCVRLGARVGAGLLARPAKG